MSDAKPAPDCAMVIFGANGDLTKRLVVPALYNLSKSGELPLHFALIGVDHNDRTPEQWREQLHEFLVKTLTKPGSEAGSNTVDEAAWKRLADAMSYVSGDFNDAGTFQKLKTHLAERDEKDKLGGNALFYLATADRFFGPLVDALSGVGLLKEEGQGWRRVVIEKPFGHDLASARALNARVLKDMREEQVFRIDHFLGKETVQNIMALRFANGLFEPIWNRDRIDHVQITVAETVGVERRGNFYEATGALRDMVPNHLFQLLAMTAMEPPSSFDAEDVRAKKADVFKAIRPLKLQDAVRGQYDVGLVGGQPVPAYRSEQNVDPHSSVETYAAMKLEIDNWRWAGVPFYLRTGKRLTKRTSEIAIRFREAPFMLFKDTPVDELGANWLIVQIQPDEGIRLRFNAKKPGEELALEGVSMDFKYADWFKQSSAVGYETLLYDVFIGDNTLFQRADQVEAAWAVVEPVLQTWSNQKPKDFPNYAAGSAGPDAATNLIARDHRTWRKIK
jgi:glucose-6-phosphate 1-dehydrogenase